jgi:hypothetical protein
MELPGIVIKCPKCQEYTNEIKNWRGEEIICQHCSNLIYKFVKDLTPAEKRKEKNES